MATDYFDWLVVQGDRRFYLLPVAARAEGGIAGREWNLAGTRKAARDCHQVLFGDTDFNEPFWKRFAEQMHLQAFGQVGTQRDHVLIGFTGPFQSTPKPGTSRLVLNGIGQYIFRQMKITHVSVLRE
jgi:hypothetical protein